MHSKDDFQHMFDYVDDYVDSKVKQVQAVVDRLSPGTITCLRECGVLRPNVGGQGWMGDPTFWVAGGSYWAAKKAVHFSGGYFP